MVGKKRLSLGMVLTLFLCLSAVGTTIAYLYSETNVLTNAFSIGKLEVEIIENGKDPGGEELTIVPGGPTTAEKKVQVKNEGNTQAYIRVNLIPTLRDTTVDPPETAPSKVEHTSNWIITCRGYENPADKTEATTSFTLHLDQTTRGNWLYDSRTNAYYYKLPVDPGASTDLLLKEVVKHAGDWNRLNVEILADAIQVEENEDINPLEKSGWSKYVKVGNDGITLELV